MTLSGPHVGSLAIVSTWTRMQAPASCGPSVPRKRTTSCRPSPEDHDGLDAQSVVSGTAADLALPKLPRPDRGPDMT